MFSGKSEELIRRLRRAQIARQKVQIFKPLIDNRFSEDHIVSHSDMRIGSQTVKSSDELVRQVDADTEVVGIDEGQFFDPNLPTACNALAELSASRDLQPDDPPAWIRDRLRAEPRDLLIAGHFPHLPRLLALLVGGREDTAPSFPLHGIVALQTADDGETWTELWRISLP